MKKILVAEDESHLRLLLCKTLEAPDTEMLEAADGEAALELARREKPDLILLDWMMPGRTGIEVLTALREDPETAAIPVVMITARTQRADRNTAVLLGIRGYLTKPFSPLELIELVQKVLKGERVTA